jgi:amino acid transporter
MNEPPPPPASQPAPRTQDEEHLRALAVIHYVFGGLTALFACFPFIYIGVGLFMLLKPAAFDPRPPPPFLPWFFIGLGITFILAGMTLAVLFVLAGRNLSRRRRHSFCQVVAALGCVLVLLGTVLGVFTLIVLSRPSVKELFRK